MVLAIMCRPRARARILAKQRSISTVGTHRALEPSSFFLVSILAFEHEDEHEEEHDNNP
jgi:hypothetical protein